MTQSKSQRFVTEASLEDTNSFPGQFLAAKIPALVADALAAGSTAEAAAVSAMTAATSTSVLDTTTAGLLADIESKVSSSAYKNVTGESAVTHAWLGTAHASQSVRKLDGNVVTKNIVPNPGFESVVPGAAIVRTNLYKGERNSLGTGLITKDILVGGETWDRFTSVTSSSGFRGQVDFADLKNGLTYTASAEVRNEATIPVTVGVDWCDGASSAYVLQPGEQRRVSVTGSIATYTGTFRFFDLVINATGSTLLVRKILVEQTDQVRPYFNGSTPDALGWDYGWSGAVGTSTSTAKTGLTTIRTNLDVFDPLCRVGFGNASYIGTGTNAWIQGGGPTSDIPNFSRYTLSGTPVGTQGTFKNYGTSLFTVGDLISVKRWVRFPISGNVNFSLEFGAGTTVVTSVQAVVANTWTLLTLSTVIPTGFTQVTSTAYMTGAFAAAQAIDTTGSIMEKAVLAGDPFDGASQSVGDHIYSWSGTTANSTSFARGIPVVDVGNAGCSSYASLGGWVRQTPTATGTSDTNSAIGGDVGAIRLGMVAGKTYTAFAKMRLEAPQTSGLNPSARTIRAFYKTPSTGYTGVGSVQAPNVAGRSDHRITFTLPADTTEAFIRLYNGASQGGGDVYWDDFALIEGTYTGSYFDGSTTAKRVVDAFDTRYAPFSLVSGLAAEAARVITGTGSPLGLVAAPVGTEYIDTAMTAGAFKWYKASGTGITGWIVEEGDTGWRELKTLLINGWTAASGSVLIRRVGPSVYMKIYNLVATSATNDLFLAPIAGFVRSHGAGLILFPKDPATVAFLNLASGGMTFTGRSGTYGTGGFTEISWSTQDAWPTTLPGV